MFAAQALSIQHRSRRRSPASHRRPFLQTRIPVSHNLVVKPSFETMQFETDRFLEVRYIRLGANDIELNFVTLKCGQLDRGQENDLSTFVLTHAFLFEVFLELLRVVAANAKDVERLQQFDVRG